MCNEQEPMACLIRTAATIYVVIVRMMREYKERVPLGVPCKKSFLRKILRILSITHTSDGIGDRIHIALSLSKKKKEKEMLGRVLCGVNCLATVSKYDVTYDATTSCCVSSTSVTCKRGRAHHFRMA